MGFSADAQLVFGIPIQAHNDDGDPTVWWDEEADDWIDFAELQLKQDGHANPWDSLPDELNYGPRELYERWESANPGWNKAIANWADMKAAAARALNLDIQTYGHYDSGENQAILTTTRVESINGHSWKPKAVTLSDLTVSDTAISKTSDALRSLGFDVNFYDAEWYLVASYG